VDDALSRTGKLAVDNAYALPTALTFAHKPTASNYYFKIIDSMNMMNE
jgi:hypothetical protein